MSNNDVSVEDGTSQEAQIAPRSPLWAQPKSPLPPHRLAKLANALGVSTPVHHYPAHQGSSPGGLASPGLLPPEHFRRSPSPSPSNMSFSSHGPTTSKFLLHVIPPLSIPHDSDLPGHSKLTPPPPNASGYHTQFRRGTLVPVHSTLQAQLWAIAREYALPNIHGIVLYLVSNTRSPTSGPQEDFDEPGPRLSEEVWKHLWTRVWKAEQRDETFSPISPGGLAGLGIGIGTRSTPHLLQDIKSPSTPGIRQLRTPLTHSNSIDSAPVSFGVPYPSPSTPSSTSTSETPMNDHFPARSTSSHSLDSAPITPSTSLPSDADSQRGNSLDLPGLISPGLIPILAKVEFDIDRKKAGWFDPWIRSRKMNHSKRKKAARTFSETSELESPDARQPPIALRLKGRTMTASPISMFESGSGYEQLEDDDDSDDGSHDDATARIASTGKDPLAEVFGDDAETWADMRDQNVKRQSNNEPNVVNLALTAGELGTLLDQEEEGSEEDEDKEMEEVEEIMEEIMETNLLNRKHIPPPLILHNGTTSLQLTAPSPQKSSAHSDSSTALAYLQGESPIASDAEEDEGLEEGEFRQSPESKSLADSEKRVGGVFEDLDLGLDPSEDFDDRRTSQYLFSEQLDEIERNLVHLSPRALKLDLDEQQNFSHADEHFLGLPPGAVRNRDVLPASPLKGTFGGSSLSESSASPRTSEDVPSAPRLAVNGIPTGSSPRKLSVSAGLILPKKPSAPGSQDSPVIPLSPDPFGRYPSSPPEPPIQTNSKRNSKGLYWDSVPVGVPTENLKRQRESLKLNAEGQPTIPRARSGSKSSRFSTDSAQDETEEVTIQVKGKGGVVSMKTIKRLWRKSNKNSVASISNLPPVPPTPTIATAPLASPGLSVQQQSASKSSPELFLNSPTSFTFPPRPPSQQSQHLPPPTRPPRPSQDEQEFPDIPDQLSIPLQPASGRPAPMPIMAAQMLHGKRSQGGLEGLHFDQESPYPLAKKKGPSRPPSPSPPIQNQPPPESSANRSSIRKSILKWKSAAQASANANNDSATGRPSKSSIGSLASLGSNKSGGYPEAIPPSPSIPEHFLNSRPSLSSRSHSSSVDSRPDSLQSSPPRTSKSSATSTASPPARTSRDSVPSSFDDSQFEIISPKMVSSPRLPHSAS